MRGRRRRVKKSPHFAFKLWTLERLPGGLMSGTSWIWIAGICLWVGLCASPASADPFEPNNTFETAYGPLEPLTNYSCAIDSLADLDWFYFDADEGEYLIRLSNIPVGRDYDLFMSFDGVTVFTSSQNGPEFREEIIEGVSGWSQSSAPAQTRATP